MKNILIPTDFSLAAWNATEFALRLFADTKCTFYFLNAYTPEIYSNRLMAGNTLTATKSCSAKKASEKGLAMLIDRIHKNYDNDLHNFKKIPTFSLLIEEVKEAVGKYSLDLIVMGSKGTGEEETRVMGRNTFRVLEHVHSCPVLVIPKDFKFKRLTNVALVSGENYFYKEAELYPLIEIGKIFKSNVHIINIQKSADRLNSLQKLNLNTIGKTLDQIPHYSHHIIHQDSLPCRLGEFVDQYDCQIVVVFSSNNEFIKNLRLNTVVDPSVFCVDVPILSLTSSEN
ncbi:MAG: universal stress protein [Maribacter litoralis]|uniref:universal stress protein n=1 Tax=Maribacter litoralis TaxID=2059726 RepID=UPI0032978263